MRNYPCLSHSYWAALNLLLNSVRSGSVCTMERKTTRSFPLWGFQKPSLRKSWVWIPRAQPPMLNLLKHSFAFVLKFYSRFTFTFLSEIVGKEGERVQEESVLREMRGEGIERKSRKLWMTGISEQLISPSLAAE